jgi:hypothetical protein
VNDFDEAIAAKRAKAKRYVAETDRLDIGTLTAELRSEHDTRKVAYDHGTWSCSCEFFAAHGVCSHVLAVGELISRAGVPIAAPDAGLASPPEEA